MKIPNNEGAPNGPFLSQNEASSTNRVTSNNELLAKGFLWKNQTTQAIVIIALYKPTVGIYS